MSAAGATGAGSAPVRAAVGRELPPLTIPITRTLIVATAIASRDYQDVHHDPELARARGSEDIFMNILSSNGFAERYVREWAGPEARITRLRLRLGAPNYPGDAMVCTGTVTERREDADGIGIGIAVELRNSRGTHASGSVAVRFPGHLADPGNPDDPTGTTAGEHDAETRS